jgi:hypothetical protein
MLIIMPESSNSLRTAAPPATKLPLFARCFTPFQKGLAAVLGTDPNVHDLPRIMRVPGFMHWKGAPFLSRICHVSEPRRRRKADYVLPDVLEAALKKTSKKFGPWDGAAPSPRRKAKPKKDADLFNHFPHTPENKTLIRDALDRIPAGPRDNWWKAGAALHALGWDNARELWDEWSQTAPEKFVRHFQLRHDRRFRPAVPVRCSAVRAGFESAGSWGGPGQWSRVHRPLGINPGTPVSTTILNRILVATPSRISCMASSGKVESSKFS